MSEAISGALSSLQGMATTAGVTRGELLSGLNRLSLTVDRDSDKEDPRCIRRLRSDINLLRSFERNNMVDGTAPPDQAFQMMVSRLLSDSDPGTKRFLQEARDSFKLFHPSGARSDELRASAAAARACFNCGGTGHAARNCSSPQPGAAVTRGLKRRAETAGVMARPPSNFRPPPPQQHLPMLTWNGPPAGPFRPPGNY